jgi:hypothetical protein
MKIPKTFLSLCAACVATAASAAGFEAGKGVANDLATGANGRDVTFVERGGNNSYGWRSYDMVVGVTVLPWSIPNEECSVYGLRFNFGWGSYVDMFGLDSGLFSVTARNFGGFSATVFGNSTGGLVKGVQIGLVNAAQDSVYGLQVGVVNFARDLHGAQIGVLNFNGTGVACLPVLNVGF